MGTKKVIIFGATSAIAFATAKKYAAEKSEMILVARNEEKLSTVQKDLETRGADVKAVIVSDLAVSTDHDNIISEITAVFPIPDIVLIAYGSLGDQKAGEVSAAEFEKEFNVNFTSVVSLLTSIANLMSQNKSGTIAVISSVAGDRGRQSNYLYGAAKGALTIVLAGLRNRLHNDGVNVLTVKPGFVDTPMTADIKKNFLFVKPEIIADAIVLAVEKSKSIIYVPWFWRYIMLIIKLIPEVIFKRMKL